MAILDKIEAHVTVEKLLGRSETLVSVDDLKGLIDAYRGLQDTLNLLLGEVTLEVPDVARQQHKLQLALDRRRNLVRG